MTTMLEIVQDAMEEIGVKTAEVPLTNDELQSGIRRCNDLLTSWADIGTVPTYNPVLNGSDTVEIETSAVGAVKYNLAIRLAPSYQKVITPALKLMADESLAMLEASVSFIGNVAYPDTLPMGSGNDCADSYRDTRFFPVNSDENF